MKTNVDIKDADMKELLSAAAHRQNVLLMVSATLIVMALVAPTQSLQLAQDELRNLIEFRNCYRSEDLMEHLSSPPLPGRTAVKFEVGEKGGQEERILFVTPEATVTPDAMERHPPWIGTRLGVKRLDEMIAMWNLMDSISEVHRVTNRFPRLFVGKMARGSSDVVPLREQIVEMQPEVVREDFERIYDGDEYGMARECVPRSIVLPDARQFQFALRLARDEQANGDVIVYDLPVFTVRKSVNLQAALVDRGAGRFRDMKLGRFGYTFPNLAAVSGKYMDQSLERTAELLAIESKTSGESIDVLGCKIPADLIGRFGVILLLGLFASLLVQLRALTRAFQTSGARPFSLWSFLAPGSGVKGFNSLATLVLPVIATIFVLQIRPQPRPVYWAYAAAWILAAILFVAFARRAWRAWEEMGEGTPVPSDSAIVKS